MVDNSVTSMNSRVTITVSTRDGVAGFTIPPILQGVLGIPFELEEWDADKMFDFESPARAETRVGMSNQLLIGRIPYKDSATFNFAPTSPSYKIIQALDSLSNVIKETFNVAMTIDVPARGMSYESPTGTWTSFQTIAPHNRTQSAINMKFEMQAFIPGPL